ncbi:hypothetical protein TSUD_25840 [Trifolium subterraneum]|uniref:Uncharacterized protein n=1 Tax=Trifolium subterraneum TaxID=3900 RepID=A0A2Z6PGV6_TRISU|nr:hypothetical protein TSUD_25840 [Trifolium subterraneum]
MTRDSHLCPDAIARMTPIISDPVSTKEFPEASFCYYICDIFYPAYAFGINSLPNLAPVAYDQGTSIHVSDDSTPSETILQRQQTYNSIGFTQHSKLIAWQQIGNQLIQTAAATSFRSNVIPLGILLAVSACLK